MKSVHNSECQSVAPISSANPKLQFHQLTLKAIKRLWQFIVIEPMTSELRVWQTCDQLGEIWWSAYDPSTGRSIHQVSETDVRRWIEQRYYPYPKRPNPKNI